MIKILQFLVGVCGGIVLIAMTCTYLNTRFETFVFTIAAFVLGGLWSVFLFRRLIRRENARGLAMTYPTIDLGTGHTLVDNGVGDYDLICPAGGTVFIPVMLLPSLNGKQCLCGATLVVPENATAFPT